MNLYAYPVIELRDLLSKTPDLGAVLAFELLREDEKEK
jgi:hypothetical protein